MSYLEEARAMITNGIVAYGQHFELLTEDQINEDLMETIAGMLTGIEAVIPVLISMYEMTKTLNGNPDLTFMEWLEEVMRKGGGKEFGMF